MQQVSHWTMDPHEHRQELTRIINEATEGVTATKVKRRKPYVTDAILEVSAYRTRLIRTKYREENKSSSWTGKESSPFGEKLPIGLQGTSARRTFHYMILPLSITASTTLNTARMLPKVFGRERCKRVPKQEKPSMLEGVTNGFNKVISRKP